MSTEAAMDVLETYRNDYFAADIVIGPERALVICLRGELDRPSAPVLAQAVAAVPTDTSVIALDLAELAFIDAGGIWALVAATQRFEGSECEVIVARPPASISRLIEISGVDLEIDPAWGPA